MDRHRPLLRTSAMTPPPRLRTLVLAAVLLAAAPAFALRGELKKTSDEIADPRVRNMLSAAGLRFRADEDGDAVVRFRTSPGEETSVSLLSSTSRLRDLEMRDALAVAVNGSGKAPDGLFEDLLLRNRESAFGAWEWIGNEKEPDGEWAVVFRAKLPARMTPASLKAALRLVAKTAAEFRDAFEPAAPKEAE